MIILRKVSNLEKLVEEEKNGPLKRKTDRKEAYTTISIYFLSSIRNVRNDIIINAIVFSYGKANVSF